MKIVLFAVLLSKSDFIVLWSHGKFARSPYAVSPFHSVPFKCWNVPVPNEETGGHVAEASWETKKQKEVPQRLFPTEGEKKVFCALPPRWIEEHGKNEKKVERRKELVA
jgi:hypothetical protein